MFITCYYVITIEAASQNWIIFLLSKTCTNRNFDPIDGTSEGVDIPQMQVRITNLYQYFSTFVSVIIRNISRL